jgi:NAD(P)-dependent dehydrogenase (short-subunit alcohol dehydrogenase family)
MPTHCTHLSCQPAAGLPSYSAAQAVLPHLKEGSSIINTTSVNAFKGNATLIPYTATKGAEVRVAGL